MSPHRVAFPQLFLGQEPHEAGLASSVFRVLWVDFRHLQERHTVMLVEGESFCSFLTVVETKGPCCEFGVCGREDVESSLIMWKWNGC